MTRWRVGTKLGRTIYANDVCVGMVDTPELAAKIVQALIDGKFHDTCHQKRDFHRDRATKAEQKIYELNRALADRGPRMDGPVNLSECSWCGGVTVNAQTDRCLCGKELYPVSRSVPAGTRISPPTRDDGSVAVVAISYVDKVVTFGGRGPSTEDDP